ncbi:MAG TPA: APC family permease [Planctomycetota bacterium]|nr:APC family permease [Planctomycetota bacterium]
MPDLSALALLKRALLGRPLSTARAADERHGRLTGLAVFSSDALSSVAYATEEILRTLVLAGAPATRMVLPIAIVIGALLLIVVFSYRQTIQAYPAGGGAYVVAKENLGVRYGLVAAGALLTDYVLTVAVSVSAGVLALTSAVPALHGWRVELALACLAVLTIGNLRGVRESGRWFAVPTFFFIVSMLVLIAVGLFGAATAPAAGTPSLPATGSGVALFLVLRAFANGCTAMTGVEAVANGVPEFRAPAARNANSTLVALAALAVTMFLGVSLLAAYHRVLPDTDETVVSQVARAVFGGRSVPYYCLQAATMAILVLAANTAFAGFPRLASILAHDRYVPRQFSNQGDRLAFSNGILALSLLAGSLIVAFDGDPHALIPLYMVGVFVAFTLSQFGMVRQRLRVRTGAWRATVLVSGTGGALTATVLVVVGVTKFAEGAWISLALIPVLVFAFLAVRRHYDSAIAELALEGTATPPSRRNTVIIPVNGVHRAVVEAMHYARSLSPDVRAVFVDVDEEATAVTRRAWAQWGEGVPLVVLPSPYRSVLQPLLAYIERVDNERPEDYVTVVVPEVVPRRWWHFALHNQRSLLLKGALLFRPTVIVTSVPYHLRT